MRANSLAFRLFVTAALWALLVLPIAGVIIHSLYRKDVENNFNQRIALLLALVENDSADHALGNEPGAPSELGERLFDITHSGWYWQITPLDNKVEGRRLVSASLATERFSLPTELNIEPDGTEKRWADVPGPVGQKLRVAETIHLYGEGERARRYSVAVAGHLGEVEGAVARFRQQLTAALALTGIGFMIMSLLQVHFGLLPLRNVERGLARIRSGEAANLQGNLPAEIVPMQLELNALIKSNQEVVERARTQVGNLAHALKTPLAVIVNEAREASPQLGPKVIEQAEVMRTQINHYLDRARMAARTGSVGRVTEVRPVGEAIIRALERIYRDRHLDFALDCPAGLSFLGEQQDLEEMLGNLLDNASKWASGRVSLTAAPLAANGDGGRRLEIRVDDDGPGLTEAQLAEPIQRGRRLDETKPGSGLGHSIVADLAHSYQGRFELMRSASGGLSARLTLPLAADSAAEKAHTRA